MDKVISARIDEAVARQIGVLAEKLGTSKKAVLERAIWSYSREVDGGSAEDVFDRTCGAWGRDETPAETVRNVREETERALHRCEE
jgi:hypothetical protein